MLHDPPALDSLAHLAGHHGDFDAFAQLMQQTAPGRFGPLWWGVWAQYVEPTLPETARIADLGCGPGGLLPSLRQRHPNAQLHAVELQPAMLRALRPLAAELQVQVTEADLAHPLPFADSYLDAAIAVMVLHEMPNPLTLLAEVWRTLRPGGSFLVYDWARQPLEAYAEGQPLTAGLLQHFREHCLYTPDDLAFLARSAGFVVQEVIGRRGNGYAMLALRRPAE